jgi:hypothetical protein
MVAISFLTSIMAVLAAAASAAPTPEAVEPAIEARELEPRYKLYLADLAIKREGKKLYIIQYHRIDSLTCGNIVNAPAEAFSSLPVSSAQHAMDYKNGKVDFTLSAGGYDYQVKGTGNPNRLDMRWNGKKYGECRKDAWTTSVSCHGDRGDWYLEKIWSCFVQY